MTHEITVSLRLAIGQTFLVGLITLGAVDAQSVSAQDTPDWRPTGAGRQHYSVELDSTTAYQGDLSLRLSSRPGTPDSTWGASEGVINIRPYVGNFLKVVAYLKTEGAGSAVFWVRIDGEKDGKYVNWSSDTMADREVSGTTPWTKYEIRLPAPEGATMLVLGTILRGQGIVWVDDIEITPMPSSVTPTAESQPRFHEVPYREPPFIQPPTTEVGFEPDR